MNSIGINTKRGTITATVLKAMHYRNNIFRVCFENGYENIFYTNVENGKWIEEDLGYTLLAELVGTQINYYFTRFMYLKYLPGNIAY